MRYLVLVSALIYMGCSATPAAAPPPTDDTPATIRCANHPVPEFSLGADPMVGEQEQVALCDCIWSRLDEQDRKVAESLRQQGHGAVSGMESFPVHFGKAIRDCRAGA